MICQLDSCWGGRTCNSEMSYYYCCNHTKREEEEEKKNCSATNCGWAVNEVVILLQTNSDNELGNTYKTDQCSL